jgi:hypothetical protein
MKNSQENGKNHGTTNRKRFSFFDSSSHKSSNSIRASNDYPKLMDTDHEPIGGSSKSTAINNQLPGSKSSSSFKKSHGRRHSSIFSLSRYSTIQENTGISPSISNDSINNAKVRKSQSTFSLVNNDNMVRPVSTSSFDRLSWSHAKTLSGRILPLRHSQKHRASFILDDDNDELGGSSHNNNNNNNNNINFIQKTVSFDAGAVTRDSASSSFLHHQQRSTSVSSRTSMHSMASLSTILTTSQKRPLVYPALLSKVASIFRERLATGVRTKHELEYNDAFTGGEAVDMIIHILRTRDRNLALLLGRALDAQKFFHDVTYDNRLRDSQNEVYQFNEDETTTVPVNGVFTLLTDCYSPTCTRDKLCYSITCPRRLEQQARLNMKPQQVLKSEQSKITSQEDVDKEQELWILTVPKEVSASLSEREKKRQEVICELIYTERDFVKDLEYLRDFWITPLRNLNIIPESRRERLIEMVFGQTLNVYRVNVALASALTRRQQESLIVHEIGDVMLQYVSQFEPFVSYGANQAYAKYELDREKSINPAFAKFINETERMKESRKLEINGYLTKPTTRLARYPLFMDAILKATDAMSKDYENLPKARNIIRNFLTRVNIESGKSETKIQLMQLDTTLAFRVPSEKNEVKLMDPERQLLFKGGFKKRTQDKDNHGDVQCYLFDNCLLFARSKIVNKKEQLKVQKKVFLLQKVLLLFCIIV